MTDPTPTTTPTPPADPCDSTSIGTEWRPCVKLPITVHVRDQRHHETHVSTREGITPVRPDDLIMRGVRGEEYPIGRELFNMTYRLGTPAPAPTPEELQAQFRAWFQQEHGLPPSATATAHAANFALHLLSRGVQ